MFWSLATTLDQKQKHRLILASTPELLTLSTAKLHSIIAPHDLAQALRPKNPDAARLSQNTSTDRRCARSLKRFTVGREIGNNFEMAVKMCCPSHPGPR